MLTAHSICSGTQPPVRLLLSALLITLAIALSAFAADGAGQFGQGNDLRAWSPTVTGR